MFAETCTIGENKRNWDKTDIISVKHTSVAREIRYIYTYPSSPLPDHSVGIKLSRWITLALLRIMESDCWNIRYQNS